MPNTPGRRRRASHDDLAAPPLRDESARALECIRRLVTVLGESARAVEQRTGVTNAQLFVLRLLARSQETDGLTINALAARTLTQQSTVSLLVQRLEGKGYVERQRAPADARRVLVRLTRAGRAIARRAPEPPLARMLRSLDTLPGEELQALIRGLGSLLKAMKAPPMLEPLFETGKRR